MTFDRGAIEKFYGSAFIPGNRVELLSGGKEFFAAVFQSIEQAKQFICFHFYIFRNDETGVKIAESLKAKARQGVRVYILYDHFGSIDTPNSFWEDLASAGISIRASRPFIWSYPLGYFRRDHRKLIICDGIKAFTGGLNIADEYRGFHFRVKKKSWRDTGLTLEGPVAYSLFALFQKAWNKLGGAPIPPMSPPASPGSHCRTDYCLPVIPIFASSSKGRRKMRKLLYYSIKNARKGILLTTAYFTPSRRMIYSLENAVKHGVEVKLILPEISDIPAAYYAGRAFFSRLLKAGVRIYAFQNHILHAKSYVFDGCWSIVGSANLDFRSLRFNDEGNVGILDESFGQKMMSMFEDDVARSIEIKKEDWSQRPFSERLKERFFVLFKRRL